ncbi:hypothetical protein PAXRUDRAFT_36247 [Paxillus rubicundulus Ve08.2h10]|uniref:Tc1-like transposase DDE domain-containing protein n=1 Tax=Paxillus rubicundulus Ve08.2h10 TaxID=930991 RepID=A0A0D0CXF4_9AGAM|nr:hypothetical protein PAXRUDRAFT_36247 [Paxillus rubicundulus Ve08.2h10]
MVNCCIIPDLEDHTECVLWASLYFWEAIFHGFGGPSLCLLTCALSTAYKDLFTEESDLYINEVVTLTHDIAISNNILHKVAAERNEVHCEDKNELTWVSLTDVFIHGDSYSMVTAMTIEGYMAVHVIEGSFGSETCYDLIATKFPPYMNPFPAEKSVLILDNCHIHHNDKLVDLVRDACE